MSAFHLLRLPLVAVEHVLCMLNPYELIDVSQTSSRAKRSVKNFSRTRPKFRVELMINDQPCISILGRDSKIISYDYSWTLDDPIIFLVKNFNTHQITFVDMKIAKNPIEEFMKTYEYIREVFGCVIKYVHYELGAFSRRTSKTIIDFLLRQQESIPEVNIHGDFQNQSHNDVKYHISKLKVSETLEIDLSHYKNNFQLEIPKGFLNLHVLSAKFIKYEQFQRLKHQEIVLYDSRMTDRDINRFLKSWIACKSHLNLESLLIVVLRQTLDEEMMNDIPYEETTDPNILEKFDRYPFHAKVTGGLKIKRSDGKVATASAFLKPVGWCLCFLVH
uniref:F-box domain-containing protein n=1 Tax=Caenorhabditis tropicalis TaxID=1561998 RepID=A0A1I7TUN6_9PELO